MEMFQFSFSIIYMYWEMLEQRDTRKLKIAQNHCEFCQFFLSDF